MVAKAVANYGKAYELGAAGEAGEAPAGEVGEAKHALDNLVAGADCDGFLSSFNGWCGLEEIDATIGKENIKSGLEQIHISRKFAFGLEDTAKIVLDFRHTDAFAEFSRIAGLEDLDVTWTTQPATAAKRINGVLLFDEMPPVGTFRNIWVGDDYVVEQLTGLTDTSITWEMLPPDNKNLVPFSFKKYYVTIFCTKLSATETLVSIINTWESTDSDRLATGDLFGFSLQSSINNRKEVYRLALDALAGDVADDVARAKKAMDDAKKALDDAKADYDDHGCNTDAAKAGCKVKQKAVDDAEKAYKDAVKAYDDAKATAGGDGGGDSDSDSGTIVAVVVVIVILALLCGVGAFVYVKKNAGGVAHASFHNASEFANPLAGSDSDATSVNNSAYVEPSAYDFNNVDLEEGGGGGGGGDNTDGTSGYMTVGAKVTYAQHTDPSTGNTYYINKTTQEKSWTRPENAEIVQGESEA